MALNFLDSIRNLDSNKSYYLSNSTGQIKEAGRWQRFKCWLGIGSAQQKVSNLVDAVKASLIQETGGARDIERENSIHQNIMENINLGKSVKGSALKDLVSHFSIANELTPVKQKAKHYVSLSTAETVSNLLENHPDIGNVAGIKLVASHAFKTLSDGTFPVMREEGKPLKLHTSKFRSQQIKPLQKEIADLLVEISQNTRLGKPTIDERYAKHIIATLFNEDGTRNDKTIADLKTPTQVITEQAFKIGEEILDSRPHDTHKYLKEKGIDPEKKMDQIIGFCGGDKDLEDVAISVAPSLCLNSNNVVRSDEAIQEKLAGIKANLDELRTLKQTSRDGSVLSVYKEALALLGGVSFPNGLLTQLMKEVAKVPINHLKRINGLSAAEDIHEALEQVRSAVDQVLKRVDVTKAFMDNGEEDVGGPHGMASRTAILSLLLTRMDKPTQMRISRALSSNEASKMMGIVGLWKRDMEVPDHTMVTEAKDRKFLHKIAEDEELIANSLVDTLGAITNETISLEADDNADINTDAGGYIIGNFMEILSKH